jgi:hypothetical protein
VSLVNGPQIETGLDRLHALVHDRMRRATAAAAMKDAYNRLEFAPLKYSLTRQ